MVLSFDFRYLDPELDFQLWFATATTRNCSTKLCEDVMEGQASEVSNRRMVVRRSDHGFMELSSLVAELTDRSVRDTICVSSGILKPQYASKYGICHRLKGHRQDGQILILRSAWTLMY